MAASSGDRNQPEQGDVNSDDEFPEQQFPPCARVVPPEERTPESSVRRRRRPRRPPPTVTKLCLRSLRVSRHMLSTLLRWFAARPLGQRALEAVGYTLTTVERATIWAGSATGEAADRLPLPFAWYAMMPVVMALMVIRMGAALAERYLDVQLPDNRELVSWLERQRIELEELQATTAWNIRTECIDESDTTHSFLNKWPFNIPYKAAQQLGIVPVKVKQPSGAESALMPPLEPVTNPSSDSSSHSSSTLTEDDKHAAPRSREVTPPPETAGDRSMYFSPAGDKQTKENIEAEEQQDDTQEKVESEKAQEEKDEQKQPTITAEDAERAVRAVVQPQPSAPPESLPSAEEAERAAMDVAPPPPPLPPFFPASSESVLAAEGASRSEPSTSTTEQKASSKAPKKTVFLNLFGAK
ncbi:uncharacterized protein LOC126191209 [Schistocerca cancellata]|uniref:uncharacterized protein LOC126191209 n=1 Tax=Schistocerca cancellata TaxID=274614 RepID=UPI002117B0EE|nr:uncharacterized protein LOC126191209 [Schistocerca cancellata]